ncbi:MAG: hypothetical protein WA160_13105 [Pseudobdellovibrio sp.]
MALGSVSYYVSTSIRIPASVLYLRELLFFILLLYLVLKKIDLRFVIAIGLLCSFLFIHIIFISGFSELTIFGFRGLIPLLLLFSLPKADCKGLDLVFLNRLVKVLFISNFLFQSINLFFGRGIYGKFFFDINARNPGFFLYPAASAFFILVVSYIYLKINKQVSYFAIAFFFASLIMCASLTGLSGAAVLIGIQFRKKEIKKFIFSLGLLFFGLLYFHVARMSMIDTNYLRFVNKDQPVINKVIQETKNPAIPPSEVAKPNLNKIEMVEAPEYLKETGGGRLNILFKTLKSADYFPNHFGYFSSAAINYSNGIVADSLLTSFVGNLGILWSIVIGAFLLGLVINLYIQKQSLDVIFLVLVCSMGLNVQETGLSILLAIVSRFLKVQPAKKLI